MSLALALTSGTLLVAVPCALAGGGSGGGKDDKGAPAQAKNEQASSPAAAPTSSSEPAKDDKPKQGDPPKAEKKDEKKDEAPAQGKGEDGATNSTPASPASSAAPAKSDEKSEGKADKPGAEPGKGESRQEGDAGKSDCGKIDQALAAAASKAAKKNPRAVLKVIAYGDLTRAKQKSGAKRRRALDAIGAESLELTVDKLDELAADGLVEYVAPDYPVLPAGADGPTAALLANLYPQVVGAPEAWRRGLTGAGVGIAVIDSGVEQRDDFDELVNVSIGVRAGPAGDDYGHGTLVAGVAAGSSTDGRFVGIAPGAGLFGVDIASSDGVYTSDVIAGISWTINNAHRYGIRVLVLSLTETAVSSYLRNPLNLAVEQAWRRGIVVVASAGNLGPGHALYAPGNDPFVITVGATDANETVSTDDDVVAAFSATGPTVDGFAKPELLAPGRLVASTLPASSTLAGEAPFGNWVAPGYVRISGTSFAAPQVAGAAALLLQQRPGLDPDEVKWLLMHSARGLDGAQGGVLDIGAATAHEGAIGRANGGLGYVAPSGSLSAGLREANLAAASAQSWNAQSWNAQSWNAQSWNAQSWNAQSWNAQSWNAQSWNAQSWNAQSWN